MKRLLFLVSTLFILHSSFSIALASPAHIPQTGQTTCYDTNGTETSCDGTGQDGETRMGIAWPSPRFIDNSIALPAEQTVTDNLTGLIWAKEGNLITNRDSSFDADGTPQDGAVTWQHALDYVRKLNDDNYLGYNDWRLPNRDELASLTSKGETNPARWLNTQGFSNIQENGYWSSSSSTPYPNYAWYVYMSVDFVYYFNKTSNFYVLPVRGGQLGPFGALKLPKTGQKACYDESGSIIDCSGTGQDGELQTGAIWPEPRFIDNSDQTMYDNLTGLIWSKDANPAEVKNWQGALDYIKTLKSNSYLGHNDWRLPNRNELDTLVNKGQGNISAWLNTLGFNNVRAGYYWTSSNDAYYLHAARSVFMPNGEVDTANKTSFFYVWPVRGGYSGTVVHLNIAKDGAGKGAINPDNGTISRNGTNDYLLNAVVTLTAAPDPGSSFSGWSGACSGTSPCILTMDRAKSVTATFVPTETLLPGSWSYGDMVLNATAVVKSFTISNNGIAPLTVTGVSITGANPTQFSVSPGSCAILTPTLDPGTNCTLNVSFYPTTQGSKSAILHLTTSSVNSPTLDAQLSGIGIIPYYSLTMTSQGTGSGRVYYSSGGSCTDNCTQSFASGRPLQLTPVAASGSQFSGWSGCDRVTGDTCYVTMTEAKSIAASFNLAPSLVEQWVGNGPSGGIIGSLAINPSSPATVFAGTYFNGGLYRSNDGGASWNQSDSGLIDGYVYTLAINPLNPSTLYADTVNGGLFRSDDSGANWSLLNSGLQGARALVVNPASPDIIYASGCGGVCKSSDGGASWNPVNNGITLPYLTTEVNSLVINPAQPDTLYAGAQGGLDMYGGIFKSTDGGNVWIPLNILTHSSYTPLAIDPIAPDTLYAGTSGGGAYKSTDAGATWNAVNNGLSNLFVKALAVNPAIPSIIYAGTEGGVFRSTDGGGNWSPVNNGLTTIDVTELAVDPATPSSVYAGTNGGGVFKLTMVTAVPSIAVSPTSNDFGSVATYSSSTTQPFTISNSGNGDLLVTATTLGGANAGEFSLQPGSCPSLKPTVAPGASCTMEVTFIPITVGSRIATLQVASSDPDNPIKSVALTGFAYDPPPIGMITINSGASIINSTNVTLALAAFDNSGIVTDMRFSNSNTSWSDWEPYGTSMAWTLTTLGGDGSKTVFVQFRDGAGNPSGSFADSITLDTTPPFSTITSAPGPFYPSAAGTFTFSATESATFRCQLDSGPWGACSSPFSFSSLTDGSHTFSIKGTDIAGNPEATAKSYTFFIDTTAPDTTITGQPAALTNSAGGMFTFSSPDAVAIYQCKLDAGAWSHCFSQFSFTGVADGIHTFSVKAIDRSGNSDLTPATFTWTVDTVPPDTNITNHPSNPTTQAYAMFGFSSPDATASFECSLDGSQFASCTSPNGYVYLAIGSHNYQVRAKDQAGNVDPTPASYSWTFSCNVRVMGGSCYASIGEALSAAPDGGTIQVKTMSFLEALNFNYPKSLSFSGGYGPNFEPPTPGAMTTVNGLTMINGVMTVENLVIR